ncbi:MAG: S8 family peptidase [Lewinellaceae bacterium]|nr:S8 family peptidase [Lewinellaceae bacterium]
MSDQREQPHVFLNNEVLTNDRYTYLRRPQNNNDEPQEEKDYSYQQQRFARFLTDFEADQDRRHEQRDLTLEIPEHVDYIEIRFFKPFDGKLENLFVRQYGLYPAKFWFFNKIVLFAINDEATFETFKEEIRAFLEMEDPNRESDDFRNEIKLIEAFRFFSSEKIRESFQEELTYIELISEGLTPDAYRAISEKLFSYLDEEEIVYTYDSNANTIEVRNISNATIDLVVNNFDVIGKVNAAKTTKVTPGEFGEVHRGFGFSIRTNEDLPIIGIIDTGVSYRTPLSPLILNPDNHSYDLTGTSVLQDKVEHGTSVACLACLGNQIHLNPESEEFHADANILSIKVMDDNAAILQRSQVIELIRKAYAEFGVKIFTLTVTENHRHKWDNEEVSKYAFLLDKIAYELDILIIISIGNRNELMDLQSGEALAYPDLFLTEESNLEAPSESFNNLTVGAIADNFEEDDHNGTTPNKKFPAIYTRTYHFNEETSLLNQFQKNKALFKPDVVFQGGDYDIRLDWGTSPALRLLSSRINNEGGFHRNVGTSFATPLAANLAARIISKYPTIKMQTVKALIINCSKYPWDTNSVPGELSNIEKVVHQVIGHGIPDPEACLSSFDDEITIIKEDSIRLDNHKVIPIRVPEYLLEIDKERVLEIKATLCYNFEPLIDNHLGYCPIHISFGIFRNVPISGSSTDDIKLKSYSSWSEDYYFKAKLLSNVQKVKVNISKENIRQENNQFLLAIRSKVNKILPERMQEKYQRMDHNFSVVIKIKELGKSPTGRLYSEMHAINELQAITIIDLEAEGSV